MTTDQNIVRYFPNNAYTHGVQSVSGLRLLFFREADGSVPMLDWLAALQFEPRLKCYVRLERLKALGHGLRRPEAEYLGGGLYELRAVSSGTQYRMIYFFQGRSAVVVSHGFAKHQSRVPEREIAMALRRRQLCQSDPNKHTFPYE